MFFSGLLEDYQTLREAVVCRYVVLVTDTFW